MARSPCSQRLRAVRGTTGGFSVQFIAIEDFGTLEAASKLAEKFDYTGFLGLDYRGSESGFVVIECNPRLTAGVFVTPEAWTGEAVLGMAKDGLHLASAGKRLQSRPSVWEPFDTFQNVLLKEEET